MKDADLQNEKFIKREKIKMKNQTNQRRQTILPATIATIIIFGAFGSVFAQTKTVTGNYCGQTIGNRGGTFGFVVGSEIKAFELNFGLKSGNAKMVRFNVNTVKVGDEFVIKYDANDTILAITGTGNNAKTAPCTVE